MGLEIHDRYFSNRRGYDMGNNKKIVKGNMLDAAIAISFGQRITDRVYELVEQQKKDIMKTYGLDYSEA